MIELGWREWVALPDLDIPRLRAKIDTGARTSALHVDRQWRFTEAGAPWVGFTLTTGKAGSRTIEAQAAIFDERAVTDSGGRRGVRVFIQTRAGRRGRAASHRNQPERSIRHALPDVARTHRTGRHVHG